MGYIDTTVLICWPFFFKMAALATVGYIKTNCFECFDQICEFCHLQNILHCTDVEYCVRIRRNEYRIHLFSMSSAVEVIQYIHVKEISDAIFVNYK